MQDWYSKAENVFAVMKRDANDDEPSRVITFGEIALSEKLEKFVEDVKYVKCYFFPCL